MFCDNALTSSCQFPSTFFVKSLPLLLFHLILALHFIHCFAMRFPFSLALVFVNYFSFYLQWQIVFIFLAFASHFAFNNKGFFILFVVVIFFFHFVYIHFLFCLHQQFFLHLLFIFNYNDKGFLIFVYYVILLILNIVASHSFISFVFSKFFLPMHHFQIVHNFNCTLFLVQGSHTLLHFFVNQGGEGMSRHRFMRSTLLCNIKL